MTLGLAIWLATSPFLSGYRSSALTINDVVVGALIAVCALLSLSPRFAPVRWATAGLGLWLLFAPLVFWAPTAASYLTDTLIGGLVIGFSILSRPPPGITAAADSTGPTTPPGWDFSPSSWFQRAPIIALAIVGLLVSRYLAAYQLGHIDSVWEPFFAGGADPKNGTEEIITSWVSEAWPVSDAGVGAVTYMLEILTGLIGSARRWRTMPWLVVLFGILIVPLGVVSITFIVIQPILLGTWCSLCLIAAAAMLIQIPYSLDELVATGQFLNRRRKAGANLIRIFFTGDTDDGRFERKDDDFSRPPSELLYDMVAGGVGVPWNLVACLGIGVWLMFTRLSLGMDGIAADTDHLIGSLVLTVTVTALADVARPVRFLNMALGAALLVSAFAYGAGALSMASSILCGLALIVLSIRRGGITHRYGEWNRLLI
ncbi:MAG: vitamin K epoxide reductase family protein [Alphaproteobacteria bacterium]